LISSPIFSVYFGKAVDGGDEYGGGIWKTFLVTRLERLKF
jgi:hypothetical protein